MAKEQFAQHIQEYNSNKAEIDRLLKRQEELEQLLLGDVGLNQPAKIETPRQRTDITAPFPSGKKADEQAQWLLREFFKRPAIFPDIKDKAKKYGSKSDLQYGLRLCVSKGLIVKAKWKNTNMYTYYGLPEWTTGTGKAREWKPEYIPGDDPKFSEGKWVFVNKF